MTTILTQGAGEAFYSLEHMNQSVRQWIRNVADQRIHGTTHRIPAEAFQEELLQPFNLSRFRSVDFHEQPVRIVWLVSQPIVTLSLGSMLVSKLKSIRPRLTKSGSYIKEALLLSTIS